MHAAVEGSFPAWLDQDPELLQADLARRFPGVPSWHGEWTGSWWAVVGDRLLEAAGPFALAEMIRTALAASRRPPAPARPEPPPRPRPAPGPEPRPRSAARPRPPRRHAAARPSGGFFGRLRSLLAPTTPAR